MRTKTFIRITFASHLLRTLSWDSYTTVALPLHVFITLAPLAINVHLGHPGQWIKQDRNQKH